MAVIEIALGARSYGITIEPGLLSRAAEALKPFARADRVLIVTDHQVAKHVLPGIETALSDAGLAVKCFTVPAGEASKSWAQLERLCDWLLDLGVERGDHIVALGGGVVGDLVGFAASIVKRGCGFVQIPTTLLAQVDSSVGGKTAINCAAGKNLIGAFHQPAAVLIDPQVLGTLPDREMRAGYAEVVKYGLIDDAAFFAWCESNGYGVLAREPEALGHAIATSIRAKARIVAADERETKDLRALLNLGHTFGHALEADTGFGERLLHGEAVAAGMVLAYRFSAAQGLCPAADADRVAAHLSASGLPTTLRAAGVTGNGAALVGHMRHDKKMAGGTLPFLLARGIGQTYVDKTVSLDAVAAFLDGADARG